VVFLGSKSCARDAIVIFNGGRLKAGVAAAPYRVDLKLQLAKTLFYTDQLTELVEWLRPAINDNNADPEFLYYLGRSALVTRVVSEKLMSMENSSRSQGTHIAITDATLISRSPLVVTAEVDGTMMMMSVNQNKYFRLDDIANDIWQRIEPPCLFAELVDRLVDDYDADRATIVADVRALLDRMIAQDIVKFI
jgi:hypothetical protein